MPKKATGTEESAPKKSTKKLTVKTQRGKAMRSGWADIKNDNPNGKEDFENLLTKIVKQADSNTKPRSR